MSIWASPHCASAAVRVLRFCWNASNPRMERVAMNNIELQTIKTTFDEDGIMTVWIDVPGKSVNTIGEQMLGDLTKAVTHIENEKPKGVIFASKKHENF